MAEKSPKVRFAPSPTGYLHIGGARTALFNYLYAKNRGGTFLLRIEDTDLQRSSEEMTAKILEGLAWLGMQPDEKPVLQSDYRDEHVAAAQKMLYEGTAYRCFCSKEQLDLDRKEAEKQKRPYSYNQRCRYLNEADIHEKLKINLSYTLRMKIPETGVTRFKDMVYKNIEVKNEEIDDFILLRSDGSPVYHLAVVVDDARMGITHVIRGEDHLSNTPKQIHIYLALAYKVPRFAHLPLILGEDGKRLSKRTGAASVEEFKDLGFLPEAVVNSLALLGWSHKSNGTVFDFQTLIQDFELARINKKSAIFDLNKMTYINGQHLSRLDAETLYPAVVEEWLKAGLITKEDVQNKKTDLILAVDLLKQRIKLNSEFVKFGRWLFRDPEDYDSEGVQKYWAHDLLPQLFNKLIITTDTIEFVSVDLENTLRVVAEEADVKAAVLIHALRLAITGFTVSPDLFLILERLGKETVIRRMNNALEQMKK